VSIQTVEELKKAIQTAIELEHSTIPVYLTAYFSIKPEQNVEVANIIWTIVREEMTHLALACNLLNAIDGKPQINTFNFVPKYPGHLPGGIRPDLIVHLRKCSIMQLREVFMQIEEPEETINPDKNYTK